MDTSAQHTMETIRLGLTVSHCANTVIALTVLLLCMFEAVSSPARITGDGSEYLSYTYNIARGHGPNIVEIPPRTRLYITQKISRLNDPATARALGSGRHVDEFISDTDGRVISWHFWGYSALATPAYLALSAIGADPAQAFTATNFVFVIGLLLYLACGSRQDVALRSLFASLFMLSGTTFYVWWSHPEVMTASLAALGLLTWLDRRPVSAATCLALAATQNPPLALLIVLPVHSGLAKILRKPREPNQVYSATISLLGIGFVSLIAFIPSVWYLWRIGVANPIVAAGAAKFSTENFAKSIDLFLDLDQGMVLIQCTAFFLLCAWMIQALFHFHAATHSARRRLLKVLILLTLTEFMAVMAASATNWNPGITVISRYSYWLTVPVLVALCVALDGIAATHLRKWLELALVFSALSLIALFGLHGKASDYLSFTPPARFAMRLLPNWYFPHPEVFCERVQAKEGCNFDRPYVYARADGQPLKTLVEENYILHSCGTPAREVPARREAYDGKSLLWFTGSVTCRSGEPLPGTVPTRTTVR